MQQLRIANLEKIHFAARLSLLIACICSSTSAASSQDSAACNGVVTLEAGDESGTAIATATGFFIAPFVVVTSWHFAADAHALRLLGEIPDPYIPNANRVLWSSRSRDIAIISFGCRGTHVKPIATMPPIAGEWYSACGAPHGLSEVMTSLQYSGPTTVRNEEYLLFAGPAAPGSSGSPIMDSSGSVIGLVSSRHKDDSWIVFASPVIGLPIPELSQSAPLFSEWAAGQVTEVEARQSQEIIMEAKQLYLVAMGGIIQEYIDRYGLVPRAVSSCPVRGVCHRSRWHGAATLED
jgi:hypothetical protein